MSPDVAKTKVLRPTQFPEKVTKDHHRIGLGRPDAKEHQREAQALKAQKQQLEARLALELQAADGSGGVALAPRAAQLKQQLADTSRQLVSAQSIRQTCPQDHWLVQSVCSGNTKCDGCDKDVPSGEIVRGCHRDDCDYDLCGACSGAGTKPLQIYAKRIYDQCPACRQKRFDDCKCAADTGLPVLHDLVHLSPEAAAKQQRACPVWQSIAISCCCTHW